jgi:hypothetical protein
MGGNWKIILRGDASWDSGWYNTDNKISFTVGLSSGEYISTATHNERYQEDSHSRVFQSRYYYKETTNPNTGVVHSGANFELSCPSWGGSDFPKYYGSSAYTIMYINIVISVHTYSVSVDGNGGYLYAMSNGSHSHGSSIYITSNGSKTGYSLSYFTTSAGHSLGPGSYLTITENLTITAHWAINQYNYSINLNGGTANYHGYGTGNYNYNTQIRLPSVSRTGHSLSSYKIGNTNLSQGQYYNIPHYNITLVVNWTINPYSFTINHDNDDIASSGNNSITTSYTLNWNTHVNLSNYNGMLQSKKGYSHTGWSTNSFNIPDNNNTLITALWSINQYNFYIDHNNDDIAISGVNKSANTVISSINYNTLINLSSYNNRVIYKKGHSHTGWSTNSFNIPDNNNTVISALWTVNKYNIILSSDNINSVHYNKKILNESTYYERDYNSTIVIENPKVIGYNFKEWVPDENNIESSFTNSKHYNEDVDRNYYASWEIKRNGIVKFKDLEDTFKTPSQNEIKFSDYINNLELTKNISFREHVKGKGIKEVVT